MRRILVFTTNWLGDALFLSPLLAALKDNFTQSHLAVLLVPRVKEIFQNSPHVDEIIFYDERNKKMSFISRLESIFKLQKKPFDTAFIIKPSLSRTLMLKCAGIKQIIGFDNPKSGWLLAVKVPPPHKAMHKIDYFLTLLEHLHLKIKHRKYQFFPSAEDKIYVEGLLLQKGIAQNLPLIVMNPGANWHPKRWPSENFAELIGRIKERLPVNIAITGRAEDVDLAKKIIRQSGEEVFDFAGQTSLGQLGALMEAADVVVSADSGPMHIAAAVGTRVIALFGPTSARITGPYPLGNHIIIQRDIGCEVPCYESGCVDYRCMKTISAGEVAEKIESLMAL